MNNPIRYTDPSGHTHEKNEWDSCAGHGVACYESRWHEAHGYQKVGGKWKYTGKLNIRDGDIAKEVLGEAGITLEGSWNATDAVAAATGVFDLGNKILGGSQPGAYKTVGSLLGGTVSMYDPSYVPLHRCFGGSACAFTKHTVYFYNSSVTKYKTVHELAHIIDWNNSIFVQFPKEGVILSYSQAFPQGLANMPITDYATQNLPGTNWESWGEAVGVWVYGSKYPGYKNPLTTQQSNFIESVLTQDGWQ